MKYSDADTMTHQQIVEECEALGMQVRRVPAEGRHAYAAFYHENARRIGPSVYWSTSTLGNLLGLPRVRGGKCGSCCDTHARTIKEIRYLVLR
jgi:hypothetical protein